MPTLKMEVILDLRIRSAPLAVEETFIRWLHPGEFIEVERDIRQATDSRIWRKHREGWSAEVGSEGELMLLQVLPSSDTDTIPMKVINPVEVRTQPLLDDLYEHSLEVGEIIEAYHATPRVIAGDYVFVKHTQGWSAQVEISSCTPYLRTLTPEESADYSLSHPKHP